MVWSTSRSWEGPGRPGEECELFHVFTQHSLSACSIFHPDWGGHPAVTETAVGPAGMGPPQFSGGITHHQEEAQSHSQTVTRRAQAEGSELG